MINLQSCMKRNVIAIPVQATLNEAVDTFAKHHIGLLPVLDAAGVVVGVLGMQDLLALALPAFVNLFENIAFIQDFGAAETKSPDAVLLAELVEKRMRPATVVKQDSGLLRAYALMLDRNLYDLPVVDDDGCLVGIVSRVDIGAAILALWDKPT